MIQNDLQNLAHPITELQLLPGNPRRGDIDAVKRSLEAFGQRKPIVVRRSDSVVIAGNHTLQAAQALGWDEIAVVWVDDDEVTSKAFALADNRTAELGDYDEEALADLINDVGSLNPGLLESSGWDDKAVKELLDRVEQIELPTDVDEVPEDVAAVSKLGDVWLLGDHRVMCGDSTDAKNVAKLMNRKTAQLLHADPPYGMGKENDGVLNDNLYASKLDEFQMAWWNTCRKFLDDNASAYIWGNPEDLWRLWYGGGLKDSERLTMRNEIVWVKPSGFGQTSELMRSYSPNTERCLFFMLGEQGFNNNSDNYWEGWENVRSYLETEMEKCGGRKNWKAALGNGMGSHYFTKSQWCFPTKEAYEKLQAFGRGDAFEQDYDAVKQDYDAFKQDYDALKQDFYSTRAYFDNAHDNMNEVWEFQKVSGAERHGHATPKPVEMIARVFKSSAPIDSITLEPFGGSGSTLIAAQETNRVAYLMELDPHYVDVICARYQKVTGVLPVLESSGKVHDFLNA
jgi:DNA modification methylase